MEVSVIEQATSPEPETAVCMAARNDYYAGNIMDDSLSEIMSSIDGDFYAEKKENLLLKLLKQEHYGPFEHPQIMFHVENMSRVTMAQITRHRHMSFDIQSMRYVDFEDADVATPKSLTDHDHFTRDEGLIEMSESHQDLLLEKFENQVEDSVDTYNELVDQGVPKEDARYILPLGTQVNVTFSGNLRTMLHVLNMRSKANAQWEIRDLTEQLGDKLDEWAPVTANYFEENGPFKLGM